VKFIKVGGKETVMKIDGSALRRSAVLAIAITLFAFLAASGQQDKKLAQLQQAQQENAKQLRQYSWKSRTEIRKDGESKSTQLYLVRYGVDGTLQQTLIGGTPPPSIPTHGLRGLIAKRRKEEFMKTLDGLGALAKSYGNLAPEKMQHFMANASIAPETNAQKMLLRIQGRDVLQPGDSMTLYLDAATRRQRRVEIQTTYDDKPVRIVSEFQDLPCGPTFMAHSVVDYPSKELAISTDNFEHTREK
jgi:hypothetical protein